MVYIYKEYTHIFDTPAKMEQESVIVNKIMELLNKNKYDNIYDFINRNQTYQDFLKNNELENVVRHFGNTLNEADFKMIQDAMVKLTEKKRTFEKENIKTSYGEVFIEGDVAKIKYNNEIIMNYNIDNILLILYSIF